MLRKRARIIINNLGATLKDIWKTSRHSPDAYWEHTKKRNNRCR